VVDDQEAATTELKSEDEITKLIDQVIPPITTETFESNEVHFEIDEGNLTDSPLRKIDLKD